MELLLLPLIWLAMATAAASVAGSKGRSRIAFFLTGLVFPPIALLWAIGVSDNRPPPGPADRRPRRACPECAELVLASARRCPHCNSTLDPVRGGWLRGLFWGPVSPRR